MVNYCPEQIRIADRFVRRIGPSGNSLLGVYKSGSDDNHVVVCKTNFTKPRMYVCYTGGRMYVCYTGGRMYVCYTGGRMYVCYTGGRMYVCYTGGRMYVCYTWGRMYVCYTGSGKGTVNSIYELTMNSICHIRSV